MVTTVDLEVDEVLKRADALEFRDRLGAALDDEAQRRENFYNDLRPGDRHEFINGETVLASPQRWEHSELVEAIADAAKAATRMSGDGRVKSEAMMTRLTRNDYHPDVCYWRQEVVDTFTPAQTVFPAPDFVVEVLSESTAHRDRGVKFEDYAAHGVREYWIVDPDERTVEQYILDGNAYKLRRKLDAGVLKCEVIAGFEIDVASIFG
ncbi:MAG: Uma2 family endonuclease [Planctomycetota bacterium]